MENEKIFGKKTVKWGWLGGFKGDKIVLMVLLLLMMVSLIAISGSTPLLAMQTKTTRMSVIGKHVIVTAIGMLLIFVIYNVPNSKWLERLSKLGFPVSLLLLLLLVCKVHFGNFLNAEYRNGAYRTLGIMGQQIHVFEVVKVAMVMYLAWACKAFRYDSFILSKKIAGITVLKNGEEKRPFAFVDSKWGEVCFYILIPIVTISGLVLYGGFSSGMFIMGIMILTVLIGGVDFKYIFAMGCACIVLVGCIFGIYKATDGKVFTRFGTAISRTSGKPTFDELMETRKSKGRNSKEYGDMLQKVQQPYSARIAVHESGTRPKGIGGSTGKYVVPVMYGDFMFDYIIEETGIVGAVFIIILYLSLLARGSVIIRNCSDSYDRTVVGGLLLLITGQALFHMCINLDMGPLTGQTLPMISHGSSSYICFSIAFGVILAISKNAHEKTAEQEMEADIEHGRSVEETVSTSTASVGDFSGESGTGSGDIHEETTPTYTSSSSRYY